jgi:hypothetical protein
MRARATPAKAICEEELTAIGSLSKWPSLRHANDNKRRL